MPSTVRFPQVVPLARANQSAGCKTARSCEDRLQLQLARCSLESREGSRLIGQQPLRRRTCCSEVQGQQPSPSFGSATPHTRPANHRQFSARTAVQLTPRTCLGHTLVPSTPDLSAAHVVTHAAPRDLWKAVQSQGAVHSRRCAHSLHCRAYMRGQRTFASGYCSSSACVHADI